jgi:dienelactone hydrolase
MKSDVIMRSDLRLFAGIATVILVGSATALTAQQSGTAADGHETIFYTAGGLSLEAYVYTPAGGGPYPLVVYNHGSRAGEEREERPIAFIGHLLTEAGYAVLIPERRGYGKSEGKAFSDEIGADRGAKFVARLQSETDDALAALEYVLRSRSNLIDARRIAMMGWSFGGIVAVLGAGRSDRFAAVVAQAPGALTWDRSQELREALTTAAGHIHVPLQCVVAENDATTESARTVCSTASKHGAPAQLKIYPSFTPTELRVPANAKGHALFGPQGVSIWRDDVLAFLSKTLPPRK